MGFVRRIAAVVVAGFIAYQLDYGPETIQSVKSTVFYVLATIVILWLLVSLVGRRRSGRLKGAPDIPWLAPPDLYEQDKILKVTSTTYAILFLIVHRFVNPDNFTLEMSAVGYFLFLAPQFLLYWWRNYVVRSRNEVN